MKKIRRMRRKRKKSVPVWISTLNWMLMSNHSYTFQCIPSTQHQFQVDGCILRSKCRTIFYCPSAERIENVLKLDSVWFEANDGSFHAIRWETEISTGTVTSVVVSMWNQYSSYRFACSSSDNRWLKFRCCTVAEYKRINTEEIKWNACFAQTLRHR